MVWCKCKWPVFYKYCGVCSLRTGICIKSVINLTILVLKSKATIGLMYFVIMRMHDEHLDYRSSDKPDHSLDIIERDKEDRLELPSMHEIFRSILIICAIQQLLCIVYMIVICCTVYAVCKKKANMLIICFYINIPNWLFDLLISCLVGIHPTFNFTALVIIFIVRLIEPYNLLAIRSEYLRLTEKVPPAHNESVEMHQTYHTWYINPRTGDPERDAIHCRTCTCNLTPKLENIQPEQSITEAPATQESDDQPTPDKELNFKEQPIIFDQDQVIQQGSSIIQTNAEEAPSHSRTMTRPTNLSLNVNELEKKVDLSEVPVIYDQSQLNVGSSPILEDKT